MCDVCVRVLVCILSLFVKVQCEIAFLHKTFNLISILLFSGRELHT